MPQGRLPTKKMLNLTQKNNVRNTASFCPAVFIVVFTHFIIIKLCKTHVVARALLIQSNNWIHCIIPKAEGLSLGKVSSLIERLRYMDQRFAIEALEKSTRN